MHRGGGGGEEEEEFTFIWTSNLTLTEEFEAMVGGAIKSVIISEIIFHFQFHPSPTNRQRRVIVKWKLL